MRCISLIILASLTLTGISQVNITLLPEAVISDQKVKYYRDAGTTFYNYQGYLFAIIYNDNLAYVYIWNKEHNQTALTPFNFGLKHKNIIDWGFEVGRLYEWQPLGKTFAFEYNNRLWYFQHVYYKYFQQEWTWECYAQLPTDTLSECSLFHHAHTPPPDIFKQAAFQLDSLLYFIGRNENSQSSHYGKWCIQKYFYYEKSNTFNIDQNAPVPYINNIPGSRLGGLIPRHDTANNPYYIINTFDRGGSTYTGKLIPHIVPGEETTFSYIPFSDGSGISNCGASTIVRGTFQGNRTPDQQQNPWLSNRMGMFIVNDTKSGDGTYHMRYNEFAIVNDDLYLQHNGEVTLPTASSPHEVNDKKSIWGSFELAGQHMTDYIQGINGLQQYIWIFYPRKDDYVCGAKFASDQWRIVNNSVISSTDLADTSYPNIRNLWSLTGIVDGSPPCAINWPVWHATHAPSVEPTELTFVTEQESETEISSSYEDKYTLGEEIQMGEKSKLAEVSFNEEFKYSHAFRQKYSSGTRIINNYSESFGMSEESQEYGFFIWTIPQIKRFTYMLYPWWDYQFIYPDSSSLQFRFQTFGTSIYTEPIELGEYPFLVGEPNGESLNDWKSDSRIGISNTSYMYGISPIFNVSWSDHSNGNVASLNVSHDSTSSYESSNTYEWKFGAQVKIPKVFDLDVSASYGQDLCYSNETTVKTRFGNEIEVSLKNLKDKADGVNLSYLDIGVFWFRPEDGVKYWYWDSLADQRPWYIAYIVNSCQTKIIPIVPVSGTKIKESEIIFSWKTVDGDLGDYTLYISKSPFIRPSTTIEQKSTGDKTSTTIRIQPEKGITYYWIVRGRSDIGEVVWSPAQSFTLAEDGCESSETKTIIAQIFPNPVVSDHINMLVDVPSPGQVDLTIFDITGKILYNNKIQVGEAGLSSIQLPVIDLKPGLYLLEIRTSGLTTVKKISVI